MKRLAGKQTQILEDLAPRIVNYRSLQAKANTLTENVSDYESAEVARYWQQRADDALDDIEFWVSEAYSSMPYKATKNRAIDAFMRLVMGDD